MDYKSASRIACFINDTEQGSIFIHLKDLTQELVFKTLDEEQIYKFHPAIELRYEGLKIQAFTHIITDFDRNPIFGTQNNPLPPFDFSAGLVNQFDAISKHVFKEKFHFHFASANAVKLVSLVVGMEEIRLKFDGMELKKEELAHENQVEFSQLLYRTFAIHNPEVNCVSKCELTHFAEKNITIVPTLKDGAWLIYATQSTDIFTNVVDHYALWDGFDGEPQYFTAQIRRHTHHAFTKVLKTHDWETSPNTNELLYTFEVREMGGDVYMKSMLDTLMGE